MSQPNQLSEWDFPLPEHIVMLRPHGNSDENTLYHLRLEVANMEFLVDQMHECLEEESFVAGSQTPWERHGERILYRHYQIRGFKNGGPRKTSWAIEFHPNTAEVSCVGGPVEEIIQA
jgi:hypothetical protein